MPTVSLLPLLVAAVAAFAIGFLWHGPLFGKLWMQLSGITPAQMEAAKQKNMAVPMIVAFIQQLVSAYVISYLASLLGVLDVMTSVIFTFWVWLGFVAMPNLNGVLWENRSVKLYAFNVIYYFVSILAMTLIVALWK